MQAFIGILFQVFSNTFLDAFLLISSFGNFFDLCLFYYFLRRRGNKQFDDHFRWIRHVHFRRKMKKTQFSEEENDGRLFFYRQSRHYSFVDDMIKVLFPICTLSWRVNNYFSRQGKV